MTDPLYLGIDGGGTACRARLTDAAGQVLGEGRAGGANPRFGLAAATEAILAATHQALGAAGLPAEAAERVHAGFGLAGVGQRRDRAAFLEWRHPFAAAALATDAHAACLGAHAGGDGAVLILGTGSCGLAIVDGLETRIGGWGFPVSDHAGGAWLGLEAIRRGLWAHDGVAGGSDLTEAVMARFDHDPEALVAWLDTAMPRDYGDFAPLVVEHAERLDPVAMALLAQAAHDAAWMIAALQDTGAPRLSVMGGLAPPVVRRLPEPMVEQLAEPLGDALDGALLLARQAAG
jgi:glucosamine kinase